MYQHLRNDIGGIIEIYKGGVTKEVHWSFESLFFFESLLIDKIMLTLSVSVIRWMIGNITKKSGHNSAPSVRGK